MTFEIVIENGTLVTMDGQSQVLENHSLGINKGKIAAIFPAGSSSFWAKEKINAQNCLVTPGLINAHSHLPMTYFRGLADDLPLQKWLQEYIWPLEAKLVNPEFVYDATLHGAAEMLKNGISTTNDMYFHMGSIADACIKAGLRVIISEALIDHQLTEEDRNCCIGNRIKKLREDYRDQPLIDFSLAPHSIYTCSPDTLKKCAEVAKENGFLIHMHLSETSEEVQNCVKTHGKKPVEYINDLGLLEVNGVLAHGIWVDDEEMDILARNGKSSIAICTESHLKLISGFAPLKKYQEKGINLCLGTDGVASNNNLDLLEEVSLTAKLHKAINNDPTLLPAKAAFALVTCNAAQAIGRSRELGSLEKGKLADIAIFDLDKLENQPVYNPYSQLVYAMGSNSVRDLLINGRIVMQNRHLTRINEDLLLKRAKAYCDLIRKEIS
ncbi:amidohydrolase family protein [Candidatus Cloacimonadaceae bacterium]